jgi:hypothetical protein
MDRAAPAEPQAIDDDHLMAGQDELLDGDAADIASATRYQDTHGHSFSREWSVARRQASVGKVREEGRPLCRCSPY